MTGCRAAMLLVAVVVIITATVHGQENANPTIPDRLLDCYQNASIYHRDNRLPMTIRSLIDLVRKIEASPTGRNMNARELSSSLQYFLRLDGIQVSPNTQQTDAIVPFAPGGTEYYKHRLSLVRLLSKPSRDDDDFLNENLTPKEVCNLHFMLSYSIDIFKRPDESCSAIISETGYKQLGDPVPPYQTPYPGGYEPYPAYPGGQGGQGGYRAPRYGREATNDQSDQDVVRSMRRRVARTLATLRDAPAELEKDYISRRLQDVAFELIQGQRRIRRAAEKENEDKNVQVEVFPPQSVQDANQSDEGDKNADFTIGKNTMLGPGLDNPLRGGYEQGKIVPSSSVEKRMTPRVAVNPKYSSDLPLSDCPVENGVIYTPYGSVTIGTVIAGIASGLSPQQINPIDLNVKPSSIKPEMANVRVDNVWATTLSGNVAEMILSTGAQDTFNQAVGVKGGWNDTYNPKWYLLQNKNVKFLTDVELRGGLDGLWLGKNVASWMQRFGQLKLSQILDMYYSTSGSAFDPKVQACNRRQYLNEYAETQEFQNQVHIFSLVLMNQRVNEVTFKDFTVLALTAVQNVQNYVPQLDRSCDSTNQPTNSPKTDVNANMLLVLDTNWDQAAASNVLQFFINEEVAATPFQSNLTIMCGSTGDILAVITDSTGLRTNFTTETYRNCTGGMNLDNLAYSTETFYRQLYIQEQMTNAINTQTQILMFLPAGSLSVTNNNPEDTNPENQPTYKYKKLFATNFPDVRVLVATTAAKDSWNAIVVDPADVFTIQAPRPGDRTPTDSLKAVTNSVKQIPHRLSKPKCGSYFVYEQGDATVRENVQIGFTKYYKLEPNYFYDVGSGDSAAKVTVQGLRNSKLQVCYYRTNPVTGGTRGSTPAYYPPSTTPTTLAPGNYRLGWQTDGSRTTDTNNCKTITTDQLTIDLVDPCSGKGTIAECDPLYITVTADFDSADASTVNPNCNNCRLPTNVEYTISVVSLSCKSTAAAMLATPLLILACIFLRYLNLL